MSSWFVYIIESESGKLYTGITTDVDRRFFEHLTGVGGAKFFRGDPPKALCYVENYRNRSEASIRECEIKRFSRRQKEDLLSLFSFEISKK